MLVNFCLQMKSRRPTSSVHKPDTQWQSSSPINWTMGHVIRDSPVGYQAIQTSVGPLNCFGGSTVMTLESPAPSHYTGAIVSGSSISPALSNPPLYGLRPSSLEVPQSVKVTDFASGIYERSHISSPVGQGFLGRPPYHQHHDVQPV